MAAFENFKHRAIAEHLICSIAIPIVSSTPCSLVSFFFFRSFRVVFVDSFTATRVAMLAG